MSVGIISSSVYPVELISSSIELASRAGDRCIENSGVKKEKIGILIYVGISRDKNVVEPALSTIIQKNMNLNIDPVGGRNPHSTFAFDLFNTELGFLYAAQVADGFISTGKTEYVMITSSDVHPSQEKTKGYPFSHIGAAVLLARSEEKKKGFQHYFFKTAEGGNPGYSTYASIYKYGVEGRKSLEVNLDADFEARSLEFAIKAVNEFSEVKNVNLKDIKFVITSQFFKDFGKRVAKAIGLEEINAVDIFDKYGNPHTSTLQIGYHYLKHSGFMSPGDKILFVGIGAGLAAGVGLYVA
jgi:3-oxoacyl-[acyl-carrier-protein] synthase-3